VLKHRARRGDTLSTLARHYGVSMKAIRYANGLRSSRLRAGRVYRIPTCVVADGGPIVVPSRRLPPTEDGPMAINEPALPEPPVIAAGKQVSHLSIHP
jgi:LysM repeat protein